MHDPEVWWTSTPAVAKNRLVVAVEVSKMRRRRISGEEGRSLVERSLNSSAMAEAGLVASSDQDPPLFRC